MVLAPLSKSSPLSSFSLLAVMALPGPIISLVCSILASIALARYVVPTYLNSNPVGTLQTRLSLEW